MSAALVQRAQLLNLVVADLYGPQRLILEGILPPEVIFSNPLYLRACIACPFHMIPIFNSMQRMSPRNARGDWQLLADRTQAPSGAGYAVEKSHRVVAHVARKYAACEVQRLAGFFINVRESLQSLCPRQRENPRIVLMSPGPTARLFRRCIYGPLLGLYTRRGGRSHRTRQSSLSKNSRRLDSVDVIMRRVADEDCDPLELSATSLTGVPGLTHAVRSGNVVIANPLGSNLLEAPIFMAFGQRLAQYFFKQDWPSTVSQPGGVVILNR